MWTRSCAVGYVASAAALLLAVSPAQAAPKRITGKLSKPGLTVIALAANGKAKSVQARRGRFSLRAPARRVSLHLRARNGRYAGPIVVGRERRGRRALVGVKRGARLGRIRVRRPYARTVRRLRSESIDARRWARARRGVPKGTGRNFGRVRTVPSPSAPEDDRDRDAVPDPLDIDDDGDLILDNVDLSPARARAAQVPQQFHVQTELVLPFQDTVNVNAGSTDAQIDAALVGGRNHGGRLHIETLPGDSAELDCGGSPNPSPPPPLLGGLFYCSIGGTGEVWFGGEDPLPLYPDCCDDDGDGFGTLPQGLFLTLAHRATAAQIKTGDLLIQRVTSAGVETQFTATVQYVFVTSPALVSYSDTAGNSGTISYPATTDNPLPVAAGPDGHVVLTLTFWRPQRPRIAGDPVPGAGDSSAWTDIGGLAYEVHISSLEGVPGGSQGMHEGGVGGTQCPPAAFSTSDPNLTPTPPTHSTEAGGFIDLAPDRPANRASTLTYTVDVMRCLPPGVSWDAERTIGLDFFARTNTPANSHQSGVPFRREE